MIPTEDNKLQAMYVKAADYLKEGEYEKAYPIFIELGDYKDSALHASRFAHLPVKIVQDDDGMMEGKTTFTTNYTYNEYGECIEKVGAYKDEVGPGFSEKNYYDDSGRLVKRESVSEAGCSTEIYEYNADGKLIKKTGCTDGANVGGITTYTYDEKGNRTTSRFDSYLGIDTENYGSQEPYHSENYRYYYDKQNRCVKMEQQYGEEYLFTYTVEYNENSLPLKITADDGQGTVNETVFSYNDKGQCTEIDTDYEKSTYSYLDSDTPITAIRTRDGGEDCHATYSYDLFYLRNDKDPIPFHIKEHLLFLSE
jgi:hypothetical protein